MSTLIKRWGLDAWPGTDIVRPWIILDDEAVAEATFRLSKMISIEPTKIFHEFDDQNAFVPAVSINFGRSEITIRDTDRRDLHRTITYRWTDFVAGRGTAFECARPMDKQSIVLGEGGAS